MVGLSTPASTSAVSRSIGCSAGAGGVTGGAGEGLFPPEGEVQLKLGPVVIDDGIEVEVPAAAQQAQAVQHLDRQAFPVDGPGQILLKGLPTGLQGPFAGFDLGETGVRPGVSYGNLGPD